MLVNKHKVQLRKFSDPMIKRIGEIAFQVVEEIGNSDPFTKRVYESYINFRKKAMGWSALAEQGYMNARSMTK